MSDLVAGTTSPSSPPKESPFGFGDGTRLTGVVTRRGNRRLRLAAALFAGDLVSGTIAIVATTTIFAVVWPADPIVSIGRVQVQTHLLLLLLMLGINGSLGIYRF